MAELLREVPVRALAVYAHPDDADVSCGGTLAKWAIAGCQVHLVVCTKGDKGSNDAHTNAESLIGKRARETAAASAIVGVDEVHHFGNPDGEIVNNEDLRADLVEMIREVRPDVVICPDPTAIFFGEHYFNHRDHREVGWATLDAVTPAAGSPLYFPTRGVAHRVKVILLSGTLEPSVYVDITETINLKADAVACHVSQLGESTEWFRSGLRQRAEEAGRAASVPFAEGYRRLTLGE